MTTTRNNLAAAAMGAVALGALFSLTAGPALAEDGRMWGLQPHAPFFEVYTYYCAPGHYGQAVATEEPTGIAHRIYTELFSAAYAGDCRAFYLKEIVRRVDVPTQQGLIVVDR
jgi:hypothetical protein